MIELLRRTRSRGGLPRAANGLVVWALVAAGGHSDSALSGQEWGRPELYGLNVFSWIGESPVAEAGLSDLQRLRLTVDPQVGPVALQVAYEQTLLLRKAGSAGVGLITAGGRGAGGDWLDLQGVLDEGDRLEWAHRVDRLVLHVPFGDRAQLRVGRQSVSWATTLIFTPADPFAPFDPSDPFREYRIGVDAARLQVFPGPFSEVDLVLRPVRWSGRTEWTAALRGTTTRGRWDLGAWGGVVHDRLAGALSASASLRGWAIRGEARLRNDESGAGRVRSSLGADRFFGLLGRDLYLVVEWIHEGLGATRPGDLLDVATSEAFLRGDLQVLGRDAAAVQLSYQWHPLLTLDLLALANLRDDSLLFAPALGWSMTASLSLRAGSFLAVGRDRFSPAAGLGSEFGSVPGVVYLSLSGYR